MGDLLRLERVETLVAQSAARQRLPAADFAAANKLDLLLDSARAAGGLPVPAPRLRLLEDAGRVMARYGRSWTTSGRPTPSRSGSRGSRSPTGTRRAGCGPRRTWTSP